MAGPQNGLIYRTTEDTVIVDKSMASVSVTTSASCGAGSSYDGPMDIKISKTNLQPLSAWASASPARLGIKPGTMKVYLRKAGERTSLQPEDIATIQELIKYYGLAGDVALSNTIANQLAQNLVFYYNSGDIKLRTEKAVTGDLDVNGRSDRAAAIQLEEFYNSKKNYKNYLNKTGFSYTPQVDALLTCQFYFSENPSAKYQVKITGDGFEQDLCKSAVVVVDKNLGWGYEYTEVVTAGDIPSNNISQWDTSVQTLANEINGPLINYMNNVMNGVISPADYYKYTASDGNSGITVRMSSSRVNMFEGGLTYKIGDSWGNNWQSVLLPDAVEINPLTVGSVGAALGTFKALVTPIKELTATQVTANQNAVKTPTVAPKVKVDIDPNKPIESIKPVQPPLVTPTPETAPKNGTPVGEQAEGI